MKASFYNVMFELENRLGIFNTKNGTLLTVNVQDKDKVACLFSDFEINVGDELMDILIKLGMVVEGDFDEYSYVKARFWQSKFIDNTMRMMLTTTFNCNFHCDYCFENIPNKKQCV